MSIRGHRDNGIAVRRTGVNGRAGLNLSVTGAGDGTVCYALAAHFKAGIAPEPGPGYGERRGRAGAPYVGTDRCDLRRWIADGESYRVAGAETCGQRQAVGFGTGAVRDGVIQHYQS